MAGVISFLDSPLVQWIKTVSSSKDDVGFQDLTDAVYLLDVLNIIDERQLGVDKVHRQAKDASARLHNWALLLKNVNTYYMDVLQQVVVMKTPDVLNIVDNPSKDSSLQELEHVLLLLLGCAVQCDRKEQYINAIKTLDINSQKALVECIKQVTDNAENVLAMDIYGDSDDEKQLYSVVKKVVLERNALVLKMVNIKIERDYFEHEVTKKKGEVTAPSSLEKYQLVRELQDYKQRVHTAIQDIEEKNKSVCEMKEELKQKQQEVAKVKAENCRLERDAKMARSYRDEVDNLKEQAMRVEKLEKEVIKYKEKVHELEYFKTRAEELREDNSLLCECKDKLEEQVTSTQGRLNNVMHDLSKVQATMDAVDKEKNDLEKRLNEAIEENAVLDFEKNRMKDGYPGPLRRMISCTSSEFLHGSHLQLASGHPISDELNDSMTSHVTRLEVENDQLKHEVEEIKSKLHNTQQEVETLISQSEKDYKKKLQSPDKEERQRQILRQEISNEMQRRYEGTISDLKSAVGEKSSIVRKYQTRMGDAEKEKLCLAEQVRGLEDQLRSTRKQYEQIQGLEDELRVSRGHVERIKTLEDELKATNGRNDQLNVKCENAQKDMKACHNRLRMSQANHLDLKQTQEDNEDLIQKLGCQREQIQQDKHLVKRVHRENEDLLERLDSQQQQWGRDRDQLILLQREKERLESERDELRCNIDAIRDCSDQHIKDLEEQLMASQDKSVAMENLNDYLANIPVSEEENGDQHQQSMNVIDTDLDAHLSLPQTPNNSMIPTTPNNSMLRTSANTSLVSSPMNDCSHGIMDRSTDMLDSNQNFVDRNHNNKNNPKVHRNNSYNGSGREMDDMNMSRDSNILRPKNRPSYNDLDSSLDSRSTSIRPNSVSTDLDISDDLEQPARIAYVKRSASHTPYSAIGQPTDKSGGSQKFLSKLKNYVKNSPKAEGSSKSSSRDHHHHRSSYSSSPRTPLHEVQLRNGDGTPKNHSSFARNSKHRSTIHGVPMMESSPLVKNEKMHTPVVEAKSRPTSVPFSRSNSLRQTMPEKRKAYEYAAERKLSASSRNASSAPRRSHDYVQSPNSMNSSHDSGNVTKVHSPTYVHNISQQSLPGYLESSSGMGMSSNTQRSHSFRAANPQFSSPASTCYDKNRRVDYSSDIDSGLEVSRENGNNNIMNASAPVLYNDQEVVDENTDIRRLVTSVQIMSTETVESYYKKSNGRTAEKIRLMADKLLQVQDKNQALLGDNKHLRKILESMSGGSGSLLTLEKRTRELESENRKLRIIVETLQNTLSGKNPYDSKEYHYFTNV